MSATLPRTPTERLAWIVGWLIDCVGTEGNKNRVSGLLLLAIAAHVRRICARFLAAAAAPPHPDRPARADATPAPALPPAAAPPPTSAPTLGPEAAPPAPRAPAQAAPGKPRLPRRHAWVIRMFRSATGSLAQLESLLRDPEMIALLAGNPRLGRILRPLCWMLGVHPSLMPAPPRRRRKPAVAVACEGDPDSPATAAKPGRRRRPRFNLRGRDLLFRLRMGPSPYWP